MSVFLIGEHRDGQVRKVTFEILSELQKQGQSPTVIFLGTGLDALTPSLAEHGASKVVFLENEALKNYRTEAYANALYEYLAKQNPTLVTTGCTSQGKDFLPRLAAKFKVGIGMDCTEFNASAKSAKRPVYAGKCTKVVEFLKAPMMFSVRPNVLPMQTATAQTPSVEKVAANIGTVRTDLKEVVGGGVKKVELTEADVIISGGRSLKNADNFKILFECAEPIGAAVGASRAAVDAGYAPHDMQVGQTGKTVSPKLYIACGISGAIQHLAGMRTSKVIVAINKDPEAPIFQKADYGIVGDLFEIIPLLKEELKKLKAHS